MAAIIELAERLGKAIADSPQATALRTARDDLSKHEDIKQTLDDFRVQQEKVAQLEAEQKPVEVDDKHKLQELHTVLVSSEIFKKYTSAQVDYVDVMRKVNQAITSQLAATEGG
jgi:cell fate (sporulation/competence/biofilm development) regulator YlbF (YheA/YmcA/DUF963 family)